VTRQPTSTRDGKQSSAVPGHRSRHRARARRAMRVALAVGILTATFNLLQMNAAAALANEAGVPQAQAAPADEITMSRDNLRTGWDPYEPNLTPSTVSSTSFGKLFATKVQGQVYAQPLVVGNTVLVGTEDNWAYGLNASTGTIIWQHQLGKTWPASAIGCGDLTPNIGNTSAGVYDPSSGTFYLTTKVDDGPDKQHPNWYLHALDATTGTERTNWPMKIAGTPTNDSAHPFNAFVQHQRPGLLLMNGVVYMGFGSHCDIGNYVGLVAGVNTTTRSIRIWSSEVGTTGQKGAVWQSGGGLVSDGPGRIFLTTGNGTTAPDAPSSPVPPHRSESVVRLGVAANGTMTAQQFFSPSNAKFLDDHDLDLGSGGPVGLPSTFGTPSVPNLLVQIGKDGRLFLLNRDRLGGKNQKPGGGDNVVQTLGGFKGVWGHPAVYGGQGGYVYVVQRDGTMLVFKRSVNSQGAPRLGLVAKTPQMFGFGSGSPIVTSNGTSSGSAVVWVVRVNDGSGANGQLCAYNAIPSGSTLQQLRCFSIGTGVKFTTAASASGRVYTGTRDGFVYGFGLLP
jgi:outer membrane protein assembly factor BamB